MIIKTLFLASFMIASAFASADEENKPFPAALLVQSNFDFSLIRKEFRVHYGGLRADSATPGQVYIQIYNPDGSEAHKYNLEQSEMNERNAFQFALDNVNDGKYEVKVCADSVCSAKTPSLNDVVTKYGEHKLSCEPLVSTDQKIEVTFVEPTDEHWAEDSDYPAFSKKINEARESARNRAGASAGPTEIYETDYEKYKMNKNPYYDGQKNIFHIAIKHDLRNYRPFFDKKKVDDYCGRKNMLSLHSHIVNKRTRKVVHRFKTVNHLSEGGKQLFINGEGGPILLESTHKGVDIKNGRYEIWVSLCVTDKDTVESTYCANPITKDFTVGEQ